MSKHSEQIMRLAKEAANKWRHEYMGTEHVLIGLLGIHDPVCEAVLLSYTTVWNIEREVIKLLQEGPDSVLPSEHLPTTPRAKKILEYALEESRGGETTAADFLIGALREQEGVAAQVLMNLGLKEDEVRERIQRQRIKNELAQLLREAGIKDLPARAALKFLRLIEIEMKRQEISAEALEEFAGFVSAHYEADWPMDDGLRAFERLMQDARDFQRVGDYFRQKVAEHDRA